MRSMIPGKPKKFAAPFIASPKQAKAARPPAIATPATRFANPSGPKRASSHPSPASTSGNTGSKKRSFGG